MTHSVRSRLWIGLAAGVLAVAATAGSAKAASTPGPNTPEQVPTGLLASALPGASAFGNTAPDTPEQVSFILKERNRAQLESAVTGGLSGFDSVSQFTAKYGQSASVVSALTGYLASFGITTSVYPGNVDVSASGTAGEFDAALSTVTKNYHVPAQHGADGYQVPAQTVYCSTGAPKLPYHLAQYVLAILGLTNYAPFDSHAIQVNSKLTVKASAGSTGDQPTDYLPSDFAARYGLTPLYKKANGAGETIGIVTLAALDPGAPQYFWQNVAKVPTTGRTVTVDNVDGGPGAPSDAAGTGETDLDVEQSGALAPGANVIDYQAPNSDPGFIDGFFAAASENIADTVSTSWGESETFVAAAVAAGQEPAAYQAAFDEAFLELADQGQSFFVASGDFGAYTAFADLGTTNLSVGTPDDSPYVTSAGGTTTPWSGPLTGPDGTANVTVTEGARLGLGLPVGADRGHHGGLVRGHGQGQHRRRRRRLQRRRARAVLSEAGVGYLRLPRGAVPDADRLPVGADRHQLRRADRLERHLYPAAHLRLRFRPGGARPVRERRPVHRLPAVRAVGRRRGQPGT